MYTCFLLHLVCARHLVIVGMVHCRQLNVEMAELRAGKESQGSTTGKENQGTSADSTRTSGSLLRRLGLKKAKDRSAISRFAASPSVALGHFPSSCANAIFVPGCTLQCGVVHMPSTVPSLHVTGSLSIQLCSDWHPVCMACDTAQPASMTHPKSCSCIACFVP